MTPCRIFTIIPAFGRTDAIVMADFLRQQCPQNISLHLLIVDNGNPQPLAEQFAAIAADDCRILRLEHNQGGAGAFRAGMLLALETPCDFVWLLDDDAELTPETLTGLLTEYQRLEAEGIRVGAVGSVQLGQIHRDTITSAGGQLCPITGRYQPYCEGQTFSRATFATHEVHYLAATSLLTRPEVIRHVGPFEPMFIHCDDWEWCYRVGAAGYHLFITGQSVIHHPEWESKPADWIVYYDIRNYLWSLRRHAPKALPIARLLRRLQQLFYLMHGRKKIAHLMQLGFKHADSGQLLMRDELPWRPSKHVALNAFLKSASFVTIILWHQSDVDQWQQRLRQYNLKGQVIACRSGRSFLFDLLRMAGLHLWAQFRHLVAKQAVLLLDHSCLKRYPFPFIATRRAFCRETTHGVELTLD